MKATKYLIVEDEFLIAETIAETLANAGCKDVRIANSGEEAINEIELQAPDIVLTDINLGEGKSGIDLGNLLQKKYNIPFIYITSYSDPETVRNAKVTRPNAYLIKPFKNEDLLVAIELALFNSASRNNDETNSDELLIKDGRVLVRLSCSNITWLETDGNYVTIYLVDGNRKLIRITLTELKRQLNEKQFLQIHKSYLINRKYVSEVRTNSVKILNTELPIGRAFQADVNAFFK